MSFGGGNWQASPHQAALLQMVMRMMAQRQASPFAMPPPAGGPPSPGYNPQQPPAALLGPQQGGQNSWQLQMLMAQLNPLLQAQIANSMPQLALQQGMYPGSAPPQGP